MREVGMEALGVESSAGQPEAQGRFTNAEDALQGIQGHAFGEQCEDEADDSGRSTEAIEGRITSVGEFVTAGLTAKIADVIMSVSSIGDEGVDARIREEAIGTLCMMTGVACGRDDFLAPPSTSDVGPWRGRRISRAEFERWGGLRLAVGTIGGWA